MELEHYPSMLIEVVMDSGVFFLDPVSKVSSKLIRHSLMLFPYLNLVFYFFFSQIQIRIGLRWTLSIASLANVVG